MYANLMARESVGFGLGIWVVAAAVAVAVEGVFSNRASHIALDRALPMDFNSSTISGVYEVLSNVSDRILEMCVPKLRCMPEHSAIL